MCFQVHEAWQLQTHKLGHPRATVTSGARVSVFACYLCLAPSLFSPSSTSSIKVHPPNNLIPNFWLKVPTATGVRVEVAIQELIFVSYPINLSYLGGKFSV